MTGQIVPRRAGPPWRILGLLAALVLLGHALVLRMPTARLGLAPAPPPGRVAVLDTRSIPAAPPPEAGAPAAPMQPAPVPAQPAKKPVFKKKPAFAHAPPVPAAIDSIAQSPAQPAAPPDASAPGPDQAAPSHPAGDTAGAEDAAGAAAATAAASASQAASSPSSDLSAPSASSVSSDAPAPAPAPAATPVTAMALPASAQLTYRMTGSAKGLVYRAKGELMWRHDGASYSAGMTVRALFLGARTMHSAGQVGAQGLAPARFADKSRTELAAHFEPEKGQISFSANTPPAAWQPGAQDRVSVVLQLGGMLAGNPSGFADGSTITVFTAGPRDADYWTFVVEGAQVLSLPFGELATLKLSRQPRRPYDQKVELWYAPALGYLPVRNKITQANGDFVDQELSELARP